MKKKRFHVKHQENWSEVSLFDRDKVIMSVPVSFGLNIAKYIAKNMSSTLNGLNEEIQQLKEKANGKENG